YVFFFQAEDGIRDRNVTGVQTCALPIYLITVYPLDKESIIEAANKTGKILLITEDNLEGCIMSEVSAIIAENCLFQLDAPVRRLAGLDVPSMPYAAPL